MSEVIVQEIEKQCSSDIEKAVKYYTVLFSLNSIDLSPIETKVIAFTAVKGNINLPGLRKEFIEIFDSSNGSLENIKCKLIKLGFLIKDNKKCVVNPVLKLEFNKEVRVYITLKTIITVPSLELKEELNDSFQIQ